MKKILTDSFCDVDWFILVDNAHTAVASFITRQEVGAKARLFQFFNGNVFGCTFSFLYTKHIRILLLYIIQSTFLKQQTSIAVYPVIYMSV